MPGFYIGERRNVPPLSPESHNGDVVPHVTGVRPNRYAEPDVTVRNGGPGAARAQVEVCWSPATTGAALTVCRKFGWLGDPASLETEVINPGEQSGPQNFTQFQVVDQAYKLVARINENGHSHLADVAETCPRCGVQVLP